MTALNRKLIRDLRHMAGQSLAIALVMGCGVAVLVMSVGTHRHLKQTRDAYYERSRFSDIFVQVVRAPRAVADRLAELPGVAAVDVRIEKEVTLDVPGLSEPAIGRLVSLPSSGRTRLNLPHLRRGRLVDPDRPGEVLASEAFVIANRLELGDTIQAVVNGTHQELTLVGIALSPEYIFQIRGGDMLPDDRRFGVFWMNEPEMAAVFDMEGGFNSASLSLLRGASEEDLILEVDRLMTPYGCGGAYGRNQQLSARFLSDEIRQLQAMAYVAPSIFFSVACFLLNVVLTRTITMQRGQIATLKAFGYRNREIAVHYLKFVMLIAGLGCGIGSIVGDMLARNMSEIYAQFYRFPTSVFQTDWRVNGLALAVSLVAAVLATVRPVWSGVSTPPAEAMRPPAPATYSRLWTDNVVLRVLLSPPARMVLREFQRQPRKAFLSSLGIACAVAVLILGNFGVDALDELIDFQYFRTQRHDLSVIIAQPASPAAEFELEQLPGVLSVELFRAIPVRLRAGHRHYRGSIMGLDDERDLFRLLDASEQPVLLPPDGLVLGDKLAEILHVVPGDSVEVDVLDGKRQRLLFPVAAVFREYAGTNAYMNRASLHRALQEGPSISGAFLGVDPLNVTTLYQQLKQTPRIASVSVKKAAVESFRKTVAENQLRMQSFNVIFACIIAWGVVYNTARISLAERSRELATLRVIGFTKQETFAILLGELTILTLAALPLGYAIGYGFCYAMVQSFESEMFRIPLVITGRTMAFAASTTLFAALVSALIVRRRIDELDLVGVLKSGE